MLHRVRRHLGADLVGCVALFVALGGSAGAAVVVSSNSQVGPDVIAGAKGPAGSTDNVINGSIAVNDLAPLSVTTGKLAPNAVSSGKIADGQVGTADLPPASSLRPSSTRTRSARTTSRTARS